jgi:hypothetical protein
MNDKPIATGFSCQPLPDGTVLVEFEDGGGKIVNEQVITGDAFRHLPMVVQVSQAIVDHVVGAASAE